MTKAQALAAMNAVESVKMNASAVLAFNSSGVESWGIAFDPSAVYTGTQLAEIASYCATNGLTLTAQFTALGIV